MRPSLRQKIRTGIRDLKIAYERSTASALHSCPTCNEVSSCTGTQGLTNWHECPFCGRRWVARAKWPQLDQSYLDPNWDNKEEVEKRLAEKLKREWTEERSPS
jgi:hypothetical protein